MRRYGRVLYFVLLSGALAIVLHWMLKSSKLSQWIYGQTKTKHEQLAFATLLIFSSSVKNNSEAYLTSTRILNYQLQHAASTRSSKPIPFLILITPTTPQRYTTQLQEEGALIIHVQELAMEGMKPLHERWRGMMIKLRLFELLEYDRILFLDADTFLFKPLDGVFDDLAATPQNTLQNTQIESDEAPLPSSYLFSTLPEVLNIVHSYPPLTKPYFNAGFFMLAPSTQLSEYYISLLNLSGRFDSRYPEQNLLNYAHRDNGNMPWRRLGYWWNINLPTLKDVKEGVVSVHAKLWTEGNVLQPIDPELSEKWRTVRQEMDLYYGIRG